MDKSFQSKNSGAPRFELHLLQRLRKPVCALVMGVNKDGENFVVKVTSAEIMNRICKMFRTFRDSKGLANVNCRFVVDTDDYWSLNRVTEVT